MTTHVPAHRFYLGAVIATGAPMLLVLALRELNRADYRPSPAETRAEGGVSTRFVVVRLDDV
jgi:hypothetical protein